MIVAEWAENHPLKSTELAYIGGHSLPRLYSTSSARAERCRRGRADYMRYRSLITSAPYASLTLYCYFIMPLARSNIRPATPSQAGPERSQSCPSATGPSVRPPARPPARPYTQVISRSSFNCLPDGVGDSDDIPTGFSHKASSRPRSRSSRSHASQILSSSSISSSRRSSSSNSSSNSNSRCRQPQQL